MIRNGYFLVCLFLRLLSFSRLLAVTFSRFSYSHLFTRYLHPCFLSPANPPLKPAAPT